MNLQQYFLTFMSRSSFYFNFVFNIRFLLLFSFLNLSFLVFNQTTQLKPQSCDKIYQGQWGQHGVMWCNPISGANKYKFIMQNIPGNPSYYKERLSSYHLTQLGHFTEVSDTTYYNVTVLWSNDGGQTWSQPGSVCWVKTPLIPRTKLTNSFCNKTIQSNNQTIICYGRPGAAVYRFKIQNISGNSFYLDSIDRNYQNHFKLRMFSSLTPSSIYKVSVSWRWGNKWVPYGAICLIKTPPMPLEPPNMPDRSVIGSAGRFKKKNSWNTFLNRQISYTVGEPHTLTYDLNVNYMITQGFQQSDIYPTNPSGNGNGSSSSIGQEVSFTIYPNPFSDYITIKAPKNHRSESRVLISNLNGVLLKEYWMNSSILTVNLSELEIGNYRINIFDQNGGLLDNKQLIKTIK